MRRFVKDLDIGCDPENGLKLGKRQENQRQQDCERDQKEHPVVPLLLKRVSQKAGRCRHRQDEYLIGGREIVK
jgi:hypothetical protein